MVTSNVDTQRAADLSREIIILHDKLMAEASSFNLPNAGEHMAAII